MRFTPEQMSAVVYADMFSFPLTVNECRIWAISLSPYLVSKKMQNMFVAHNGYICLAGRENLIPLRIKQEAIARAKLAIVGENLNLLKNNFFIEAVFVTGSLAVGNTKDDADIDLMIVTKPGVLWLTRLILVVILKFKNLYRQHNHFKNKFCTNIYLDKYHLEIQEKNIFTAHEVLQARCLFDRGGIERKWLESNRWAKKYLPGAYEFKTKQEKKSNKLNITNRVWWFEIWGPLIYLLEPIVFMGQYLYMKFKITKERIGLGYAFFHPKDLSQEVIKKFAERMAKLSL